MKINFRFLLVCDYNIGQMNLAFKTHSLLRDPIFVRNLVFGVEDGLVSTVGFVSGFAQTQTSAGVLGFGSIILILVEAFSMAAGSFLSESSVEDMNGKNILVWESVLGGVVMFLSYAIAGFIVVLPYFFLPIARAIPAAVATTLLMLAVLGFVSSRLSGRDPTSRILRMVIVGGLAVIFGVFIGQLVS